MENEIVKYKTAGGKKYMLRASMTKRGAFCGVWLGERKGLYNSPAQYWAYNPIPFELVPSLPPTIVKLHAQMLVDIKAGAQ